MADSREQSLRAAMGRHKKGTPEYLKARSSLNDYLESQGKRTNRLAGESKGKGGLTTAQGVIDAQTKANQVTEYGPTGASVYSTDANGNVTRTVGLSDAERAKYEGQNSRDNQINSLAYALLDKAGNSPELTTDGLPAPDFSKFDLMAAREQLAAPAQKRVQEQYARDLAALQSSLANRGIQSGTTRYEQEMQALTRGRDDATETAMANALLGAGQLNESNISGQRGILDYRDQAFEERQAVRNQPLNEAGAVLSMYDGANWPQFSPTQYTDVTTPALAFQGWSQESIQNEKNRQNALKLQQLQNSATLGVANINASSAQKIAGMNSGGGGGGFDPVNNYNQGGQAPKVGNVQTALNGGSGLSTIGNPQTQSGYSRRQGYFGNGVTGFGSTWGK